MERHSTVYFCYFLRDLLSSIGFHQTGGLLLDFIYLYSPYPPYFTDSSLGNKNSVLKRLVFSNALIKFPESDL